MIWIIFWLFCVYYMAKKWYPEPQYAIPLGTFSVMLFTYGLGILNVLHWQPYVMAGTMAAGGVDLWVAARKERLKKMDISWWLWTVGILVLAGVASALYLSKHEVIVDSDYNYYGSIVKYLWCTESFVGAERACRNFADYHPIIAIWHYYVNKCFGVYQDWHSFVSYAWLLYICMLPFLDKANFTKKKVKYVLLSFVFFAGFPWAMAGDVLYKKLAVDVAAAFLFGYGLYIVSDYKERNWLSYSGSVIIVSVTLGLSKSPAILFTCVTLLAYVTITHRQIDRDRITRGLYSVMIPVISLAMVFSWQLYYRIATDYSLKDIAGAVKSSIVGDVEAPAYTKTTVINYIKLLFTEPINATAGLTAMLIWGIVLAVILWRWFKKHDIERNEWIMLLILSGGFIIFVVGHLWMYLYKFSEPETQIMSAWARYISLYMIPILYFFLLRSKQKVGMNWIYGGVVLLLISIPYGKVRECGLNQYQYTMAEQLGYRHEIRETVLALHDYIEPDDVIGIVYSGEDLHYLRAGALRYELIPNKVEIVNCESTDELMYWVSTGWNKIFVLTEIDSEYHTGDIYSVDETKENLTLVKVN